MLSKLINAFSTPKIPSVLLALGDVGSTIDILHLVPEDGICERFSLYPSTDTFRYGGATEKAREKIGNVTIYAGDGESTRSFFGDVETRARKLRDDLSSLNIAQQQAGSVDVTQLAQDILKPAAMAAIQQREMRERSMNATQTYSVYIVYVDRSRTGKIIAAMEAVGVASSLIAVIDLTAKVGALCLQYAKEVKHAKDTIHQLRTNVDSLQVASKGLYELLNCPAGAQLKVTRQLRSAIDDSQRQVQRLHDELRPRTAREAMSRLGLRSLKWPFEKSQVENSVRELDRYTQTISLALQIDAANKVHDIDQNIVLSGLRIAEGASYDSQAQEHSPYCLPDTRVGILQEITAWAQDATSEPIFWLRGMAGTGKSTIARTIAKAFDADGQLGATFFFKKGEADRGSLAKFFMTLAADLIKRRPSITPHIKAAVEGDHSITTQNSTEQFAKFLLEPLQQMDAEGRPIVLVVDALDECGRENDVDLLLRLFSRLKTEIPGRVKFFLTSRPELPIRCGFKKIEGKYEELILHDIADLVIKHDILIFLKSELSQIRNSYNLSVAPDQPLSVDWPGQSNIEKLVAVASPLFIAAATICRFISDRRIATPIKQLKKVLDRSGDNISDLAGIYRSVLDCLVAGMSFREQHDVIEEFRAIVGSIILLANPLSTDTLAKLLDIPRADIDNRLSLMHSVLSIPVAATGPVRLLHLSFRDFLLDPSDPSMPFKVNKKDTHTALAENCLRVLDVGLKQDICGLENLATHTSSEANSAELAEFLQDARRFLFANMLAIDESPLQLYSSLILFAPVNSKVKRTFVDVPKRINLRTQLEDDWGPCIQTLEGHSDIVLSAAFSHDSLLIASGAHDQSIQIWTVQNGKRVQVLLGHSGGVDKVAFSQDSSLLLSASHDKTVRIWRVATGECIHIFQTSTEYEVWAEFTHDSKRVASIFESEAIRIWDTVSGECLDTLRTSGKLSSFAFSHESEIIALCYCNGKAEIRRSDTNTVLQILNNDSDEVPFALFSHDSRLLMAGWKHDTARIWRLNETRRQYVHARDIGGEGLRYPALSADSKLVASGSPYDIVRVWDAGTGQCVHSLSGHSGAISCVVFSHGSKLVASGGVDKTVRIWQLEEGKPRRKHEHHLGPVSLMAISQDSAQAVTASSDVALKVWCTRTGKCLRKLTGPESRIICMALSPDSALLAVSDVESKVHVWSMETGERTVIQGDGSPIPSVAFSHNSELLATSSYDSTLQIWRLETGECCYMENEYGKSNSLIAFSHDSTILASLSSEFVLRIRLWQVDDGGWAEERALDVDGNKFDLLAAFSPELNLMATMASEDEVQIWSLAIGTCVKVVNDVGFKIGSFSRLKITTQPLRLETNVGAFSLEGCDMVQLAQEGGEEEEEEEEEGKEDKEDVSAKPSGEAKTSLEVVFLVE
ncbi:hypothetical protein NLG97_g5627 [Lecanicillium saksenae]|uniref:Uncharacterized protein n=1 Tax=Lecanicillium saksenae TaxID=468837 RepID=A0ACC1QRW5_9HYPO|nr:hypothetical protein NLG97_g5627 [Lecanicillium saksenae]